MKNFRNWTYVYLSNDLTNSIQGMNLGFDNSTTSTNRVITQGNFGTYLSKNINQAIYNYRAFWSNCTVTIIIDDQSVTKIHSRFHIIFTKLIGFVKI